MIKKVLLLLLLSACASTGSFINKKDINRSIIGWWERYYPIEQTTKPIHLTHIEFFDYGEFRYTTGNYFGTQYLTNTSTSNKWKTDSLHPENILFDERHGENFLITVLNADKENMMLKLTFPDFVDTVYMKKISK